MAVVLGKRKRRTDLQKKDDPEIGGGQQEEGSEEDMRVRFKRAFEARFMPLPQAVEEDEDDEDGEGDDDDASDDEDEDEDDWSGLSGGEDEGAGEIETVDYSAMQSLNGQYDKRELRAFMSSKPPTLEPQTKPKPKPNNKPQTAPDDSPEADDLKNDLALQRLLKESHLLDAKNARTSSMVPEGKVRLKALDMRLQDLGARESHLKQEKMPMSHRKGMVAKATMREDKRRKEAVENGIVLEKARKRDVGGSSGGSGGDKLKKRRERGVGGPNVGRFASGTLKLSARDVRDIQGPRRGGRGGGRGRGGRGRKR
ncbi:hypothetical protein K431DRAFT_305012 [Polychaeton citri CBS 116435]|uniref:Protein FAF1 n=1 Tax=Polychaeton citri CBS 116435 TaxID=1314669 RepID=A0A9P4Q6Y5_9PEZI|nr:hypothetical protein K431DRAFT_305012 [Polychaeton citri CBS 116435]